MTSMSTLNPSQSEELQALFAILGADKEDGAVSFFVEDSGSPVVTVSIVLDVKPHSSTGVPIHLRRGGEAVGVCGVVENLPPVKLEATYVADYLADDYLSPADIGFSPPIAFAVSGCWLIGEAARIKADLESNLATLVSDADPSEPLIWTACLIVKGALEQVSSLTYDAEDASMMHRVLLSFNIRRRNELFKEQAHECGVCFEIKEGARFIRFECGHAFCEQCCEGLVRSTISGGEIHLKCPDTDCRELLQPHEIKGIADDELFERWTELSFKHAIASDPDFTHCPRCGGVAIEDAEDCSADCCVCHFVFCILCHDARHPGVQCVSAEAKLRMLREKAAGGSAEAIAAMRKKELELASLQLIEKTSKPCPACGEAVQKTEGCNKMTCLCGTMWCWRCNKTVGGYDHFTKDGCVLFDEAEILRWEQVFAGMLAVQDVQPALDIHLIENDGETHPIIEHNGRRNRNTQGRVNSVQCPCCRQVSYRHGGNHIRCWSCRCWFCGCCQQLLPRRGRAHFKPTGSCPQHS